MATTLNIESIRQAALELQPAARMDLTHALVRSLTDLPESEVQKLWLEEAERRDAEMEAGQVEGSPGEEVFRGLFARHRG